MWCAVLNCFWEAWHLTTRATARALLSDGSRIEISSAMIATTTSNSISVSPNMVPSNVRSHDEHSQNVMQDRCEKPTSQI